MPDNISLAVAGSAVTYFAQIAVAYGLVRILCRLTLSARGRMWLWSGFLLGALLAWLGFLAVPLGLIVAHRTGQVGPWPSSALHWSYRLETVPQLDLKVWGEWGLRFYLLLALVSLLAWGWEWLHLRVFLESGFEPSSEVSLLFHRLSRKMKVRSCQIILVPQLRSPSMTGWLRPKVLLPTELLPQLKRSELIDVLLHELIHVRRHDYLWDQFAALACRVVFFHPAVWLAYSRLRRERELACDQAMGGQLTGRRLRYAECLMNLAKWWFLADRYSAQGIGVSSPASFLATRVRILLEEPRRRSKCQILLRAGVVTAIALTGAYGVLSAGLSFYLADARPLNARAGPHTSVNRPRRVHPVNTHTRLFVQPPVASQLESNDSELPYRDQVEQALTDTEEHRSPVQSLRPASQLDRAEESWSSPANDGNFQGDTKPIWDEGTIARLPPPAWLAAAIDATLGSRSGSPLQVGVSTISGVARGDRHRRKKKRKPPRERP